MSTYAGEHGAAAIMELIRDGGEADGLTATKIVEYRAQDGRVCGGVVWQSDPDQEMYERAYAQRIQSEDTATGILAARTRVANPCVLQPRVIWTREKGGA